MADLGSFIPTYPVRDRVDRRSLLTQYPPQQEVHDFHAIAFWSVRETFVAIATTNLPAIFVLVRRWLKSIFPALQTRKRNGTRYGTVKHYMLKVWPGGGRGSGGSLPPTPPEKPSPILTGMGNSSHISSSGGRKSSLSTTTTKHPGNFQLRRMGSTASDMELISSPMPSVQDTLSNSRRRSEDSVIASPGGTRTTGGPARRGSNGRNPLDKPLPPLHGVRKQIDIMVVEEALHELGADPRLSTNPALAREDLESGLLPSAPGLAYTVPRKRTL